MLSDFSSQELILINFPASNKYGNRNLPMFNKYTGALIYLCLTHAANTLGYSLRSWQYCVGARLKFWRQSRVPKKGSRDAAVKIPPDFAARDSSAVKSHLTILQRLRRQISLDYYTIPPATQASWGINLSVSNKYRNLPMFNKLGH